MNADFSLSLARPSRVRYGVLAFCCILSMITYLDRVCFGTVAPMIQAEFALSDSQLGLLFTSFALAYAAFEVPTGWLGDLVGARKTLIRIVLWWSAFTALTGMIYPSTFAFIALLSVRFMFGVGEAGAYPNISRAFANWFPFGERGSAQGAVWMAGRFAGGLSPLAVVALVYTTTAADGSEVKHWRHIFWIFGGIGVVWCVFFWWWFRDRPQDHVSVNQAELAYIRGVPFGLAELKVGVPAAKNPGSPDFAAARQDVLGAPTVVGVQNTPPPSANKPAVPHEAEHSHSNVPWGKLLVNVNLWVLCIMYFGCAYGWYFNITWLPKYLSSEYGVTRESHGTWTFSLLAGMPLLLGSFACLVGGLLTDGFIRRTGNRKWGRRLFGAIGHGMCAICYFLSLTANSPWMFVLFVAFAAFWNDITMGSAWASCIDIGGKYAGIVSGCMNTIGNLGGAVAGFTTGWVLDFYGRETGWTINFVSFGMVYVVAVFFWLMFDATKQVPQSA
jgi:MFS family permease